MPRMIDEQRRRLSLMILIGVFLGGCGTEPSPPEGSTMTPAAIETSLDAAERYLATGSPTEAEAIAIRLVEDAPGHHGPHDLLGRIAVRRALGLQASGRDDEATRMFAVAYSHYEQATGRAPDIAGLQQAAGEIAVLAEMPAVALVHYQAAADLAPDDPRPPLYMAQVLLADGDTAEARRWIEHVLVLDPDQPHALASLAMIEAEAGDWPAAFKAISLARASQPDELGLRVMEARLHRRHGDPERALELLLALDEVDRVDVVVATELASNWLQLDEPERAVDVWSRCFAAHEGTARSGRIAVEVAHAWIEAGSMEEASVWLEQAAMLGIDPEQIESIRAAASIGGDQD
jgi:tetratricopeptide (TPR) repeat protein